MVNTIFAVFFVALASPFVVLTVFWAEAVLVHIWRHHVADR